MIRAGKNAGAQLTLAAAATTAAFFSFLPTEYKGVSELGLIAGCGMVIAFLTSITLLPALLKVLNPPGEQEPLGYAFLAPLDRFFERHRIPVIVVTLLIAIGGLPLLMYLRFDFNPMNLRSPRAESIATYTELMKDPQMNAHTAEVLAPTVEAAVEKAKRLAALPEVARVLTVQSFVPEDQDKTLADRAAGGQGAADAAQSVDDAAAAERRRSRHRAARRRAEPAPGGRPGGRNRSRRHQRAASGR